MAEPTQMYSIEIRAMSDGQLLVSMPPDRILGLRLLDAARVVMEQQYKNQGAVQIASPYEVLPTILKGITS